MVTQSYGSYSPQAIDPYPIETDLAKAAITSPAMAQSYLDLYQTQRQTSEGNYDYAMQGQHDFAKQQLQAQMAENAIKAAGEFAKIPGGMDYLRNSPDFRYALGGASDDAVSSFTAPQLRLQEATTAEKGGAGIASATNAGFAPSLASARNVTGLDIPQQQEPVGIREAQIHAAAAANKPSKEGYTINIRTALPDQTPVDMPVKILYSDTDDQIRAKVNAARHGGQLAYPGSSSGVPGVNTSGGDQDPGVSGRTQTSNPPNIGGPTRPNTAPTRPPPITRLQPASTEQMPAGGGRTQTVPTSVGGGGAVTQPQQQTVQPASRSVVTDPKLQDQAAVAFRTLPQEAKIDVIGNAKKPGQGTGNSAGGYLPLIPLVGGGFGVMGSTGRTYPLPGVR